MAKGDTQNHVLAAGLYLFLVTIVLAPFALSQAYHASSLRLALRKPTGEDYQGNSRPTISRKKTVKEDGESLATVLRRNGIQFTGSAASVFYGLNPGVSDFEYLPSGSEVNIPSVTGGLEIQNALKRGFVVYISADSPLKTEIVADVDKLLQIRSSVVNLDAGLFGSPEQKDHFTSLFLQAANHLRDVKTLVQEDTQPFMTEALRQYRDDADVLLSVAQNIVQTSRMSEAQADAVSLIAKDLATKAKGLNGSKSPDNVGRDPQATMVVALLPRNDPRSSSIRLCYAVEGLFAKRNRCSSTLGPHAKWILPVADYLVWAGMDESTPPLVKPRPVPLEEEGAVVSVELALPN